MDIKRIREEVKKIFDASERSCVRTRGNGVTNLQKINHRNGIVESWSAVLGTDFHDAYRDLQREGSS